MKSMTMWGRASLLGGDLRKLARETAFGVIGISFFLLLSACNSSQKESFVPENFVLIRGGEFTMGSPEGEVGRDAARDEYQQIGVDYSEIQHQVKVSDFSMSKYAVTVGEFRRFVEATGYQTDAEKPINGCSVILSDNKFEVVGDVNWRDGKFYSWWPSMGTFFPGVYGETHSQYIYTFNGDSRMEEMGPQHTHYGVFIYWWLSLRRWFRFEESHPVLHVSWNDAVAYCKWMTKQTGKKFRLPTEAEREYACRAGTTTPFNTGSNLTTDQANYDGNYPYNKHRKGVYRENTVPVNSFAPNAWGLYNMHGNVLEWCSDWFGGRYYDECKASGTVSNPAGPATDSLRVVRGGSWGRSAEYCRSAYRNRVPPDYRFDNVGFRLVFVP